MSGKSSRDRGHNLERLVAQTFRTKGWKDAKTARQGSGKLVDDAGRDIIDIEPFNVQCKAVQNLGSPHDTLADMPQDGRLNLLFHKRTRKGIIVAMTEDDFWRLLDLAIDSYHN